MTIPGFADTLSPYVWAHQSPVAVNRLTERKLKVIDRRAADISQRRVGRQFFTQLINQLTQQLVGILHANTQLNSPQG